MKLYIDIHTYTYIHGFCSRRHLLSVCDSKIFSLRRVGNSPTMHDGDGGDDDANDGDRDRADDDVGAINNGIC